jgi:hypothetical protein
MVEAHTGKKNLVLVSKWLMWSQQNWMPLITCRGFSAIFLTTNAGVVSAVWSWEFSIVKTAMWQTLAHNHVMAGWAAYVEMWIWTCER